MTSPPRNRTLIAVLVVVGLAVALSVGGYLLASRGGSSTTDWRSASTPYTHGSQLQIAGGKGCLTVTLSGVLRYERSTSGDRQFRNPVLVAPGMVAASRQSCIPGAAPKPVDSARLTQGWAASDGTPVGRRTATFGPSSDWTQDNTGVTLPADVGPTGKLCLEGVPVIILNGTDRHRLPTVEVCAT